jgi:hypothetical protein
VRGKLENIPHSLTCVIFDCEATRIRGDVGFANGLEVPEGAHKRAGGAADVVFDLLGGPNLILFVIVDPVR